MCGRINVSDNEGVQALMRMLGAPLFSDFQPRWNLSPTAVLKAVVAQRSPSAAPLSTTEMRWGIKAPWAEAGKSVRPLINARSETLFSKPTFRELAKAHRAIVPVCGFYEWERQEDKRIPYYVQVQEMPAMLLATVFQPITAAEIQQEWSKKALSRKPASAQMGFSFDEPEANVETTSEKLPSFTGDFAVVTTKATGELATIHHRTPVMLNIEQAKRWLYTEDPAELEAMMKPEAVAPVRIMEVSDAVNSSRNDGPECVQAVKRKN